MESRSNIWEPVCAELLEQMPAQFDAVKPALLNTVHPLLFALPLPPINFMTRGSLKRLLSVAEGMLVECHEESPFTYGRDFPNKLHEVTHQVGEEPLVALQTPRELEALLTSFRFRLTEDANVRRYFVKLITALSRCDLEEHTIDTLAEEIRSQIQRQIPHCMLTVNEDELLAAQHDKLTALFRSARYKPAYGNLVPGLPARLHDGKRSVIRQLDTIQCGASVQRIGIKALETPFVVPV